MSARPRNLAGVITFEQVSKRYPDGTLAVDGLSLEIPDGATTVLVGPSGCGKTTSLRMINRMIDPSHGRILIDGKDITSEPAPLLRRGIGYVIQNAGLFPNRTVLGNIATVPLLVGMSKRAARARASELLERVGLAPELGKRYPAQLSGGQQQRVGVARALAADPPILLMDEPFSAVDPVVRTELQDELLRLQHELGKTVVFVTHDIDEAVKLGDRLAIMAVGGRLAQFGTPAEVLEAPADDFVAAFVGRDRGYRALSFASADALPVHPEPTVKLGEPLRGNGWLLVVDDTDAPRGWVNADEHPAGQPVRQQDLRLGGTLLAPGGSVRTALDAALSSPSGRGVAVDAAGKVRGTLRPGDVFGAAERAATSGSTEAYYDEKQLTATEHAELTAAEQGADRLSKDGR
ncbi:ABC transporter ATP-binding protein [Nakamurella aerolata]|uniref:ABC-type quaternary amine transporter n=1 Tax=Nakamurella aerolata TaxID=1656892 RepID=A0A849ABY4_9ACTN|nr:ATP-binding cassette domain-containing protein [Nakamurella aerolata]NNG36648.1 ATP-binding cassette domain-containing protein [Nakamurella aerolata]